MRTALIFYFSAWMTLGQSEAIQHTLTPQMTTATHGNIAVISGYKDDPYYCAETRKNLIAFHHNFSHQKFDENGNLTNPSLAWDQDTVLTIGTSSFVAGLKAYGEVFPGLVLPDVYRVIEGDRGAVLYRVQGKQRMEFMGIKPEGRNIDFFQAEFMQFDRNSHLEELQTTSSMEIGVKQLLGQLPAGNPSKDDLDHFLVDNPQTSLAYRHATRRVATNIHENYNIGHNAANRQYVTSNVTVAVQSHEQHRGPEAFSDLIAHHSKSFSGLLYHDYGIVTDGKLAAVQWVWEGKHDGDYKAPNGTIIHATGKVVRNRGYYFFEFDCSGLIEKVTAVWNELAIESQINGTP